MLFIIRFLSFLYGYPRIFMVYMDVANVFIQGIIDMVSLRDINLTPTPKALFLLRLIFILNVFFIASFPLQQYVGCGIIMNHFVEDCINATFGVATIFWHIELENVYTKTPEAKQANMKKNE